MSRCSECEFSDEPDGVAVHLMSAHGWETDKATVWLREQIEDMEIHSSPSCCEECEYWDKIGKAV